MSPIPHGPTGNTVHNLVPMAWIEHATSPLPRECSATELHGRGFCGPGSRRLRGVYGVFGEGADRKAGSMPGDRQAGC